MRIIKYLLSLVGLYEDGPNPLALGKPLEMKCLGQAPFEFDKKEEIWFKFPKIALVQSKDLEVPQPQGPGLDLSTTDKVFVVLLTMIKDLSCNMNDQYLGLIKQVQKIDEKLDATIEQVKMWDKKVFTVSKELV